METTPQNQQEAANTVYNYAADLLVNRKQSPEQAKQTLIQQGIDKDSASVVIENLEKQIADAKKERAKKDMLYGALWCVGGTILTIADTGFIFWGAIVFGGIQFFRGVINAQ